MATLRRHPSGPAVRLVHDALVGRSPDAIVRTTGPRSSSSHASLRWTGAAWELRDLGSRNGTLLNGQPVSPGASVPLPLGATVVFGDPAERWVVEDVSAPLPAARQLGSPAVVAIEGGYITLPDAEAPEAVVFEHPSLGWLLEMPDGALDPAAHGQIITTAGGAWRLHLADDAGTLALAQAPREIAGATICFLVSPDEENVDVELRWPDEVRSLPPSVHWYIALTLARARLADQRAADHPAREQGWLHRDDLCHKLRTTARKLNVDIHRLRLLLAGAGITDGADLFQRRPSAAQIRLGLAGIELS